MENKKSIIKKHVFIVEFDKREEIGPRMLARISKHTDLTPEDL